jgi:undecaprenyl phosphate-alpha-L-ara4FN deformylase
VASDAKKVLGIKIDVDTYTGMKKGVPRILDILDQFSVKGTFFLSVGPDASGRAIIQLFKNPRFLKKMIRTNAVGLYGFRTALYGTLLPSPMIALSFPDIVREIQNKGHEVQFHAWDHRRWQDEVIERPVEWIRNWFDKGVRAFAQLTGHSPSAFGAPAWLIDDRVLDMTQNYTFDYLSCTRGREPFIHEKTGAVEIPSDLPCLEEVGINAGISTITHLLKDDRIHVLPVHAEVEGGIWSEYFIRMLEQVQGMNYRIATLCEIKELLQREKLMVRKYKMEMLPGRSTPCAV